MILVCGDAMLDRYITGVVERISPEAPVPVVKVEKEEVKNGGAANVLANIQALGAEAKGVFSRSDARVEKVRIISQGQHIVRYDYDWPQEPILPSDLPMSLFKTANFVLFSDYGKGALDLIPQLIKASTPATILVDPKGRNWEKYRGAHYIKPNIHELKDLVGGWQTEEGLAVRAFELVHYFNLKGLLLTRGAGGMTLFTPGETFHVDSVAREVYDVCGAGDTAIATFTVALSMGLHPNLATHYANKAAGIAVKHLGAYVVRREEVFSDLERMS